ncbi:hypothetical protein Lepto7376_4547 [[Leptolyngbya] sp. PCC 7376]|uniref:ATP-dependent DNA helicase n=1 Tax=[Leptolyngbya] sp. PCC 7376 TaxID=111781 RepID=UPI00029ED0D7|nr:AAA family ATPase [[Leptolyngbya] sp. PCC 7376]AFY40645.1 hypothetical protein Lepto7376_4547 [[Leptolyngbya] sp. PCC 7376]
MNNLNIGQKEAVNNFLEFWDSPAQFFFLDGSAGTGKSYTASKILGILHDEYDLRWHEVIATAPTHRAKNVLIEFMDSNDIPVECATIHKALGLSIATNEHVQETISGESQGFNDKKLVIVDEGSMVSKDLCSEIVQESFIKGNKVLVLGDSLQLTPVGDASGEFPMFSVCKHKSLLTEVMRYDGGGIADFVKASKMAVDLQVLFDWKSRYKPDFDDLEAISKTELVEHWQKCDGSKVALALKNDTVGTLNQLLRSVDSSLTPEQKKEQFTDGEQIICNSPVFEGNEIIYSNGSVLDVKGSSHYKEQISLNCGSFSFNGFAVDVNDGITPWRIITLPPSERKKLKKALKLCKDFASKQTNQNERKVAWKDYWKLNKFFADVDYLYAMTIHKSQGSSFGNVFIKRDFTWLKDHKLQPRLWYVGSSRAKKKLFIV